MCRLNHRQKIDSGMVTRLITKNAVRPPSACTGGRCRNVQ